MDYEKAQGRAAEKGRGEEKIGGIFSRITKDMPKLNR
jgi:hypothetical protein